MNTIKNSNISGEFPKRGEQLVMFREGATIFNDKYTVLADGHTNKFATFEDYARLATALDRTTAILGTATNWFIPGQILNYERQLLIEFFENWCHKQGIAIPIKPKISFDEHPCCYVGDWSSYIYFDKRPHSTKLHYALSTVGKLLPRSEICSVVHSELYGIYAQRTWYSSRQKSNYYFMYVPSEWKEHNLSVYCPRLLSKYPQPKDAILPKYSAPVNTKGTRWAC